MALSSKRGTAKTRKGSSLQILPQLFGFVSLLAGSVFLIRGGGVVSSVAAPPPPLVPPSASSRNLPDASSFSLSGPEISDALIQVRLSADDVWRDLLQEASEALRRYHSATANIVNSNNLDAVAPPPPPAHLLAPTSPLVAMEVGMHRAVQCLNAARAGMEAHCVEPSPRNMERVQGAVQREARTRRSNPAEMAAIDRVHLHAAAAGNVSGQFVSFKSTGSTGDQVVTNSGGADDSATEQLGIVKVPTLRLDDLVQKNISASYPQSLVVLKLDTQGYEPVVLEGLSETLRRHQLQFLLMEYWPRGIERMMRAVGELLPSQSDPCAPAIRILRDLRAYGYRLFALETMAHPSAPRRWQGRYKVPRPLDTIENHCRWFLDVESFFPDSNYTFGYWTDILAVAPTLLSETGEALPSSIPSHLPHLGLDTTITGRALRGLDYSTQVEKRRSDFLQARQARLAARKQQ